MNFYLNLAHSPAQWLTAFLALGLSGYELDVLRQNTVTGRPTGSEDFITQIEEQTGSVLRPLKRGAQPGANTSNIDLTEDLFA